MKTARKIIFIVLFGVACSILALQQNVYAYYAGDINKHPVILMDKRAIEIDRRMLNNAKKERDAVRIKAIKERLKRDIAKLKSDKVALKKR